VTSDELDAYLLREINDGVRVLAAIKSYSRGVSPQWLATMLRIEQGLDHHPSVEVQHSLERLRASGQIVEVPSAGCHGYMGIGLTRPVTPHRPRALQLGA